MQEKKISNNFKSKIIQIKDLDNLNQHLNQYLNHQKNEIRISRLNCMKL